MICDECGAPIDVSGYCISCGLSAPDFKDREFNQMVLRGAIGDGEVETRFREAQRNDFSSGRANRGFICNRCRELLQEQVRDDAVIEHESKSRGFEQPGSNLYTFLMKQDLDKHTEMVHGGKRFADRHIRRISANSNQRDSE